MPREVFVDSNGQKYWRRSSRQEPSSELQGNRSRTRRRSELPPRPSNLEESSSDSEDNRIIVEDPRRGVTVYKGPPKATRREDREVRFEETAHPPSKESNNQRPWAGKSNRRPVIVETAPELDPVRARRTNSSRRQDPSRSPSAKSSDGGIVQRHRHRSPQAVLVDRNQEKKEKTRRKSDATPSSSSRRQPQPPAPPPPPAYQHHSPQQPTYPQSAPGQYPPQPIEYINQPVVAEQRGSNGVVRFGKKLGNAAIFGTGFTVGADLVNSII